MFDFFGHKRKIALLEEEVKVLMEINTELEKTNKKLKDTELIVRCQKMYIEDDEGLIEILDAVKKIEQWERHKKSQARAVDLGRTQNMMINGYRRR